MSSDADDPAGEPDVVLTAGEPVADRPPWRSPSLVPGGIPLGDVDLRDLPPADRSYIAAVQRVALAPLSGEHHAARVSAAQAMVAIRGRTGRPIPEDIAALAAQAEPLPARRRSRWWRR